MTTRATINDLVIPVRSFTPAGGAFHWPGEVRLTPAGEVDSLPLGQLERDLASYLPDRPQGKADVCVVRDAAVAGDEAYRITIEPGKIEVAASADAGAYYGVQTLRALISAGDAGIPCGVIEDRPDYARRGVYHDCSRGKVPTLATLKQFVERLAHWKINELQLYVENVFAFQKHPAIGRGYSPFAPEEIAALRDHCRLHHVRLVGSLASFGHMEKILQLPEYEHLAEMAGLDATGDCSTLCPIDDGSIRLMDELFSEFVPLFDAVDFNVCCDETWELGKGRSAAAAGRDGVGRVYLDFLLKLRGLCEKYGKRMNAWADIVLEHPEMLADMPRDIVMLNWDYFPDGNRIPRTKEIVDAGLPLVVCPGTAAWISHGSRLNQSVGNVAIFAAEGRKHAAEGLLNTDWGDGGHRNPLAASLHSFAHGAAHSWHGEAVDDATFTERLCRQYYRQTDDRLASYVRLIGSTHEIIRSPSAYRVSLYRALVDPLSPPADAEKKDSIGQIPADPAREVIDRVGAAMADLPDPAGQRDEFEHLAIREYALAGRMDVLAARRVLAAADVRAGQTLPAAELNALADETAATIEQFQTLWLARSKPSRLADNVARLDAAIAECRRLRS